MLCLSTRYVCQSLIHATCIELFCENQNVRIHYCYEGMYVPVLRVPYFVPKDKLMQSFIIRSRNSEDAVSLKTYGCYSESSLQYYLQNIIAHWFMAVFETKNKNISRYSVHNNYIYYFHPSG